MFKTFFYIIRKDFVLSVTFCGGVGIENLVTFSVLLVKISYLLGSTHIALFFLIFYSKNFIISK